MYILIEVCCKNNVCYYYVLIDEVYGDLFLREDLLGYGEGEGEKFIVEMFYNFLSFYFLIKVGFDLLVKVWVCFFNL